MPRWTALRRPSMRLAPPPRTQSPHAVVSHRRRRPPELVVDPGSERRRDVTRRAQVEAMLAVIIDADERAAYLRNVRSQPREVLPR